MTKNIDQKTDWPEIVEGCLALIYQVSKNYSYPQQRVKVNECRNQLENYKGGSKGMGSKEWLQVFELKFQKLRRVT